MEQESPIVDVEDLRRVTLRLLRSLKLQGPLSADGVARLCLPTRQALIALPEEDRCRQTERLVNGLIEILEPDGSEVPFAVAIAHLRKAEDTARRGLDWSKLPPVFEREARHMARKVTDYAVSEGWIRGLEMDNQMVWSLTPYGGGAIERLERQLNGQAA